MTQQKVRISILGTAAIAPMALIRPARENPEAEVVAITARNLDRATPYAVRYTIPGMHASYEALINDPTVDAVYNLLPNGLHGR